MGEKAMTNRELIIKMLEEKDDSVFYYFMRPCIPGGQYAHCTAEDANKAQADTHCKPCILEWLEREAQCDG